MSEFVSVVTRKGQATVPAEIRRALGVQRGDQITWREENGHVTVTRARAKSVTERTAGILHAYAKPGGADLKAEREAFEQGVADEVVASMRER